MPRLRASRPSVERVRELFDYRPDTGDILWRVTRGTRKAGARAGNLKADGYRRIRFDGNSWPEHRLAWLHFYGEWPAEYLDHRDLNRSNNKIDNLRECSHSLNTHNRAKFQSNTSGFKCVEKRKGRDRWVAGFFHNGRRVNLGTFASPQEAHKAYCEKIRASVGDFARID